MIGASAFGHDRQRGYRRHGTLNNDENSDDSRELESKGYSNKEGREYNVFDNYKG